MMRLLKRWKRVRIYRKLRKDPFWDWACRLIEAEVHYCDACGETDPADLQEFIHKRMLQHVANHLKRINAEGQREETSSEPQEAGVE